MKSDNKEGYNVSVLFCLKKYSFWYAAHYRGVDIRKENLFRIYIKSRLEV